MVSSQFGLGGSQLPVVATTSKSNVGVVSVLSLYSSVKSVLLTKGSSNSMCLSSLKVFGDSFDFFLQTGALV